MSFRRARCLAAGAAISLALVGGASSHARTTAFPGSITLTAPVAGAFLRGVASVDWKWRSGTYAKSTSTVDVAYTVDGFTWTIFATAVPIRRGTVEWKTPDYPDYVYALRVQVRGTTLRSVASPLWVDNTSPEVAVTRPAPTEVIVDDQTIASVRYVIGASTVAADARDAFTGLAGVAWKLDGTDIATGNPYKYAFAVTPGKHQLTAVATDRAGNSASDTVEVLVLPGPSSVPGPTPSPTPSPSPSPSPSPTPSPTSSPSATPAPGPLPPLPVPTP